MIFTLVWLVSILPHPSDPPPIEYDVLIRNRVWHRMADDELCLSLDQVGGLVWTADGERWDWWRMTKDTGPVLRSSGLYQLHWLDRTTGRAQHVVSRAYREVDSDYDLEIWDRGAWPETERRGLPGRACP